MVIALLGLPGAGKSTLATALGERIGATALLEPEESAWPEFVRHPHPDGDFTRLTWFRSQRVPLYYAAADLRAAGQLAILDSYYDKWSVGWLGRPGLEWLIDPDDPYFALALSMAALDAERLPAADVVVTVEIDEGHWLDQLASRGRVIDRHDPFMKSHHSQALFVETALERAEHDGSRVVRHMRQRLSPQDEAEILVRDLEDQGILPVQH